MFAALRAKIEGKARDMAMQYLKSKDGQVWIKMEKYPVCVRPTAASRSRCVRLCMYASGSRWLLARHHVRC